MPSQPAAGASPDPAFGLEPADGSAGLGDGARVKLREAALFETLRHTSYSDSSRELRIALVCSGGLSLALYMHGFTCELQNLVRASRALASGVAEGVFSVDDTSRVYYGLLRDLSYGVDTHVSNGATLEPAPDAARPDVIVDIITGTSAGGINAISLAKALARNADQDSVTQLWLDKADLDRLLTPEAGDLREDVLGARPSLDSAVPVLSGVLGSNGDRESDRGVRRWWSMAQSAAHLRHVLWAAVARRLPSTVLDGEEMSRLIYQGIREMQPGDYAAETLMPAGRQLDLYVTATDFAGYPRHLRLTNRVVADRYHRHVFHFTMGDGSGADDFQPPSDMMLAFAGRATASFPGAFPPVSYAAFEEAIPQNDRTGAERWRNISRRFFRTYELNGDTRRLVRNRWFIDGGVLNSHPFDLAIEAIRRRTADGEVARHLLYLEPAPRGDVASHEQPLPRALSALVAAASTIPAEQPIVDDVVRIQTLRTKARRVSQLVELGRDSISERLLKVVPPEIRAANLAAFKASPTELSNVWERMQDDLHETTYNAYLQIKVQTALEDVARGICHVLSYPPESNHAGFVDEVIARWATRKGFDGLVDPPKPVREKIKLLKAIDLTYHERQLRFTRDAVNRLYPGLRGSPPREVDAIHFQGQVAVRPIGRPDLDRIKTLLSKKAAELGRLREYSYERAGPWIEQLFAPRVVDAFLSRSDLDVDAFLDGEHRVDSVEDLILRLESLYAAPVGSFGMDTYLQLNELLVEPPVGQAKTERECTGTAGEYVRVHYLGFPLWDAVTYPLARLSDAGEMDAISIRRCSPADSTLLKPPGAPRGRESEHKLRGRTYDNFGAFLGPDRRQNDYLWGRLDAVEQLVALLVDDAEARRRIGPGEPNGDEAAHAGVAKMKRRGFAIAGFETVLRAEESELREVADEIAYLRAQVHDLGRQYDSVNGLHPDGVPMRDQGLS